MVNWLFSAEHDLFRQTIRKFLEREIVPAIDEFEQLGVVPREVFQKVGQKGYLGIRFPESLGGLGGDVLAEAVWIEELARLGSGGLGASLSGHTTIGLTPIWRWGTEAQKVQYLRPGILGDKICALAITEPDAGSDVASLRTRAEKVNGGFLLKGSKLFITNGTQADVVIVAAKTNPDQGKRGISLFLVDSHSPGFRVSRRLQKLGWQASDTAELYFDGVTVPEDHLLGELGKGFWYLMEDFQWERITLALSAVALAARALDDAIAYTREREQFGKPLQEFQVIRHHLVDLAVDIEKARQLTYRALYVLAEEGDVSILSAMAKAYAGEMARRVSDGALQVFGGNGYMMDYPVQRYWRDARVLSIGGGATEVMYEIVAKALLHEGGKR
jgi:acyl-CoA dehydrogenase